jgi:phage virion morphogenesis protein
MSQIDELADWLKPLLQQMEPGQRKKLAREIGLGLRKRQADRIKDQKAPDGKTFIARQPRPRDEANRGPMFDQLIKFKHLKFKARSESVSVGWFSRVAHIARIHHYGMRGTVDDRYGPVIKYHERELLGLTDDDMRWIQETALDHLGNSD